MARRMATMSFKVKWKLLLTQIHCNQTHSISHQQILLKTVTCHHLHLQMNVVWTGHHLHHQMDMDLTGHRLHHQANMALMGHRHHRMRKDTLVMILTTCVALTPHRRMTWMIMV